MGGLVPLTDASRRPVHFPIVTVCIILTNFFAFALELRGGDAFVLQWSATPAQITSGHHWITILTAMFMHGSWSHILGTVSDAAWRPVSFTATCARLSRRTNQDSQCNSAGDCLGRLCRPPSLGSVEQVLLQATTLEHCAALALSGLASARRSCARFVFSLSSAFDAVTSISTSFIGAAVLTEGPFTRKLIFFQLTGNP